MAAVLPEEQLLELLVQLQVREDQHNIGKYISEQFHSIHCVTAYNCGLD